MYTAIGILILLLSFQIADALIRVGGLFNTVPENTINIQESAFRYALNIASEKYKDYDFTFEPEVAAYELERNSFKAGQSVCSLMRDGIAGIIGPQAGDSHYMIQAICDNKEIPHILTRWELDQRKASCSVNLYPQAQVLAKVFSDVVEKWQWSQYIILYEDTESLMRISNLVKAEFNKSTKVQLRRIIADELNYRPFLREVKESGYFSIILDCSLKTLPEILKQAQQVGLMGSDHSFIITNLDFHTIDLEPYKYGGTNITGFRLFDPNDKDVIKMVEELNVFANESGNLRDNMTTLPLDVALMIDAVALYAEAIFAILDTEEKRTINPVPCDSGYAWPHGFSVINHMKVNIMGGLTGIIKFDHQGFRSEFDVHIIELEEDGLHDVGKWFSNEIELYPRKSNDLTFRRINSLRNKTFTVVFPLNPPYGMLIKSHKNLFGNEQYEGFCIDLIKKLSEMNDNFSVNFIKSIDNKSGSPHMYPNKTVWWDGMVGDIINGVADLACGDLTVTREREEAVDITSVFMNLGIAILYRKPQSEPPGFFSFLSPFKTEVWILLVTSYCSVSLMFFVMGRISPYEWTNPFPCVQEPEELENQFTLSNSFWFTVGALMQQGSDIAPISVSTRMAAGVWWFFTLIMVSCYTANLAAFLTTENPNEEFTNIEELAQQTKIKYGAKKGGTTLAFFNESSEPLHKQMFNYMEVHADEVLVESTPDGVKRAAREKYAFLMESSQIEYETERECSLTQIGKPIDDKGYGIAMKKGSWYLGLFSQSILKMQEEGTLNDLKRKWWKEKYAGSCAKVEQNDAETLGLSNLGGVFIVLGGGVVVAILIAVLEQFFYVWSLHREEAVPVKEHLKRDLKFFLRCRGTTKPAGAIENGSDEDGALTYE